MLDYIWFCLMRSAAPNADAVIARNNHAFSLLLSEA